MDSQKPNIFQQLLEKKNSGQASAKSKGIISDSDLSRKFRVGEKSQPIIRRGGRNGSGKP